MESFIPEIVTAIVVPLIGAATFAIRKWFLAVVSPRQLAAAHSYASVAIDAVEEVVRGMEASPEQKLSAATDIVMSLAKRSGMKLTESEAKALVHSVLYGTRDEFEAAVDDAISDILADLMAPADSIDETVDPADVTVLRSAPDEDDEDDR